MFQKTEKGLLLIIRYAPLLFIITLAIFTTYVIELSNERRTHEDIKKNTNRYIEFNNEELKEEVYRVYDYIIEEEKNSITKLKEFIKQRVYEAHSIATKIHEDNKHNKSNKEILELIKSALGSIIYNKGRGYFFIDSAQGVSLLQPLNKELENKNKLNFKDAKGYEFVKVIVQTIKDKTERFDTYYWYKAGDKETAYKKMSFYKYFEPLDFAIGTGEYIDDHTREMKEKIIKYIQKIKLNENGYIFLLDYEGNFLAHLNQNNIGKNFLEVKDKNNVEFVKEFINISKSGEGFTSYYNSTLSQEAYKKTSFIKGYNKWAWVIGTGYNDKNLQSIIFEIQNKFNQEKNESFKVLLAISLTVTVLLLITSIFISKNLERIFKEYRTKIKEEEKEFRNLFEFSNIGLAISDNQGKFIKVNRKFTQMLGYKSKKNLLNKTWKDVSHNDFIEEEAKIYDDILSKKISKYSLEKLYVKEDGTIFDAYLTVNSFQVESEIKYILSSIVNITEIKTKDNLLFQQSKMASMGEMLANIAHQWRQPLSIISTASSGLKMHNEHGILTDKSLNDSLDTITQSSKYLSQTIDDFKDFFKPDKSKSSFKIEETINHTLKIISAQFINEKILIVKDIDNYEIKSFENDLIQVLINLFNNSKDALQNIEGERFIFIKVKKENKELVLTVTDNADGVQKEIINRIFEPYFTTKHKSQGTGIGLYMVNEIIQKHINGKIEVKNVSFNHENKMYTGAEFKIFIPMD